MANYIVSGSKFRPFSYAEMLQPVQSATVAHQELENQYGELATKASVWEEMANEQTDPYAYKMYKTYANDLEEQAGQLAREGLNAASRRDMLNMRARYSKEITPIEQAYKSRAEEIKEQTAGRANGIVYEGNASTSSLDRYLNNPSIKYNAANSKEGFQRVATAATALQKKLREYGKGKPLDGFTRTWLQEHGYRDNEVYQAINDIQGALQGDGNIRGNNVLTSILADEMNTSGVNLWKDKNARLDYFNRIAPALYQAVGQTNIGAYEDKAAVLAAEEEMRIRAEKRARAAIEEEQNNYRANPLPLRSPQEISKSNKKIQDFIDKGYLMRNNNGLVLTKRGLQELNSSNFKIPTLSWEDYKKKNPGASKSSYDSMVAQTERMGNKPNYFSTWYNKNIGGYNSLTKTVSTPTTRLNNYENSIKSNSYDVYHTTEYDRQLDAEYGKEYMTQMWSGADTENGEKVLKGVEFNGKDGWSAIKTFNKKDLKGYRVTNVRPSRYGNTAILQSDEKDKNEVIRVLIPEGINPTAEDNLIRARKNAEYFDNILKTKKQPILDRNGNLLIDSKDNVMYSNIPLTKEDMTVFDNKRNRALQDIYAYSSQIVVPSETSNEQIKPWL